MNRETAATAEGRWDVSLPAMHAGGPFKLTVRGKKVIRGERRFAWRSLDRLRPIQHDARAEWAKGLRQGQFEAGRKQTCFRKSGPPLVFVLRRENGQLERRARRLQILAGSSSARIELQGAFTLAERHKR